MADITIDTSALSYTKFTIPGRGPEVLDGAAAPTLSLLPGTYSFVQSELGEPAFRFDVADGDVVTYDAESEAFLDGKGTRNLVVRGFPVVMQTSALSEDLGLRITGRPTLGRGSHDLRLTPGRYGFFLALGLSDLEFRLGADGQVTVPPAHAGYATGNGSTLEIRGYTVTLDFRQLSHDLRPELLGNDAVLSRATTHQLTLVPSPSYRFSLKLGYTDLVYRLTPDGQVTVPPAHAGYATGNGSTLEIRGYTVTLDFRQLSHDLRPELLGNDAVLSRATTHQLTLVPSPSYRFSLKLGYTDLVYRLTPDGQVTVPPAHAGYATGNGSTLEIRGYTVTLDFRQLSHDLRPELLGNDAVLSRATTHQLTLVPSPSYRFSLKLGYTDLVYRLTPDGQVTVPPAHAGYATGNGSTLEIRGYTVTLDFRQLSHDLRPELLGNDAVLSRATTHQLTLVPSPSYRFSLKLGYTDLVYRLTPDGQVTVPPAHAGYATGNGSTLEIRGNTITLDFHGQHHDLVPDLLGHQNVVLPHTQPHQLTLVAGSFLLRSKRDSLCDVHIAVRPDGSIQPA
ncbi:hypothetical protein [Streptomyces sp. Ag109_G2-15]|uniref:hypothetical protein n=1 Tax=Streptomyces sp. Ag109_G2-15 TaxID=1938850 RepID=UPI000BCA826F|nr:hypothetical protein [Streptomyces sp. Ag109_G2-15]SOD88027.1 hypothetical protein SAMN06272765_5507 [Streptomyces sp. Ag109_G2-15]